MAAERESWKSELGLMMEENAQLKDRVYEALQKSFNRKHIDAVENFQNEFLRQDVLIALLRNELAELNRLFAHMPDGENREKQVAGKIQRMRHNISAGQQQLRVLRQNFNEYMDALKSD